MRQVLRNSEGAVIKNSSGRALKANFNFGTAFKGKRNSDTGVHWIEIPDFVGQTVLNSMSIESWYYDDTAIQNGTFQLKGDSAGTIVPMLTATEGGYTGGQRLYVNSGGAKIFNGPSSNGWRHVFMGYENLTGIIGSYNGGIAGLGGTLSSIPVHVFTVSMSDVRNDHPADRESTTRDFRIYNRLISNSEIVYAYNNGLGNEPLIEVGLIIWYRLNKAEILTFSDGAGGTYQAVGVRNERQDSLHGIIKGLPAGTLQEQADWANANLF